MVIGKGPPGSSQRRPLFEGDMDILVACFILFNAWFILGIIRKIKPG